MSKNPTKRRHSTEFKTEAVRLVEERGDRTVADIAKTLGVGENQLYAWKRDLDPTKSNDRGETAEEELQRLRREVAELKRDRDALVKSIAVFVRDRK
jgi:transposase-like protein